MVQLSIRTKSFYLKLAQSYIFFFVYFRAKHNHLLQNLLIYFFLQIVNIFLSIVCKPKRFLFCMFLFVVKWWEIPLEGSLVMCKWRAIRLLPAQEPVSIVFCEAFHLQENPFQPRTNPLWLSHHQRKKKQLSQLVRQRREKVSICSSSLRITFYHPEAELCLKSTVGRILIRWETAALTNGREQANRSGLRMTLSAHKRRLSEQ